MHDDGINQNNTHLSTVALVSALRRPYFDIYASVVTETPHDPFLPDDALSVPKSVTEQKLYISNTEGKSIVKYNGCKDLHIEVTALVTMWSHNKATVEWSHMSHLSDDPGSGRQE